MKKKNKFDVTVMNASQMRIILMPTGGKLSTVEEIDLLLEKQAEISFKAGMREVIDWINSRNSKKGVGIGEMVYLGLDWNTKLKEWGIE